MNKKEMWIKRFQEIHGNDHYDYSVIDEITNNSTKIPIKCNIHNLIFKIKPTHHYFRKQGCKLCGRLKINQHNKLTNDKVDERISKHNRQIKRIGDVKDAKTKINWKCELCDNIWNACPDSVIGKGNSGCPNCNCAEILTNEIIDNRIIKRNIIRKDDIINSHTKIRWECKNTRDGLICGFIWEATPINVTNHNTGCPKCSGKMHLTDDIIDMRLLEQKRPLKRKTSIKFKDEKDRIEWVCNKNELHVWLATTNNVLNNLRGCPKCKMPVGEVKIISILIDLNITFVTQKSFPDCKYKKKLRFDFYLPDYNICIEYQGPDHYPPMIKQSNTNPKRYNQKSFEYAKLRDEIKRDYCQKNNLKLLEIPYWDLKNIEFIILEFLKIHSLSSL